MIFQSDTSIICVSLRRPAPGDERIVKIEKSSDPLGISIQCLENGAVFVSNVEQNSLASQVGLQVC